MAVCKCESCKEVRDYSCLYDYGYGNEVKFGKWNVCPVCASEDVSVLSAEGVELERQGFVLDPP